MPSQESTTVRVLQDLRVLVHDFADADDPQGLSED